MPILPRHTPAMIAALNAHDAVCIQIEDADADGGTPIPYAHPLWETFRETSRALNAVREKELDASYARFLASL